MFWWSHKPSSTRPTLNRSIWLKWSFLLYIWKGGPSHFLLLCLQRTETDYSSAVMVHDYCLLSLCCHKRTITMVCFDIYSLKSFVASKLQVSMVSLAPVIRRNSNLRCLKAAGCRNLLFEHGEVEAMSGGNIYGDFLQEITSTCCLEDVEMGWAFCPIRVTTLIPSFSKVRKMTIGLGTTLPENILCALPDICPFLESLVLRFQVCLWLFSLLFVQ